MGQKESIYFCGNNGSGEFGDGDNAKVNSLRQCEWSENVNIDKILSGYRFTIYVSSDNVYYTAGSNKYGSCLCDKNIVAINKIKKIDFEYFKKNNIKIDKIFVKCNTDCNQVFILDKNN
eukprot:53369_1